MLHVLKLLFFVSISLNIYAENKLYIFISSSMGKELLKSYIIEAQNSDTTFVLRGLVNNSFVSTANFVSEILESTNAQIIIHDSLFEDYKITRVPSFILHNKDTNNFDKIEGNIGIKAAMDMFRDRGEVLQ